MQKQKLQTWYRYKTGNTFNKHAATTSKRIPSLKAQTRLPQKQELFAQMYKDTMGSNVTNAIKAEHATTPGEKLAIIKRMQREAYANSSAEVKQEVDKALAEKISDKVTSKKVVTSRTPKEYQECVLHILFPKGGILTSP